MTTSDTPPALQGISHVALTVQNVPDAIGFWRDAMGFEVTTETPSLGFVVHRASRIAIAVTDHGASDQAPFDENNGGLDHLALAVPGPEILASWQQRLEQHGVPHSPITESEAGHHLNLRAPGGLPIELYAINSATAAAFGIAGPDEAFAATS